MKALALLFLFACLTHAAEKPAIPANVTLQSGTVLRNVTVVRWGKDSVVLKHAGGTDPVRYDKMAEADRKAFEAHREEGVAETTRTQQAIAKGSLVAGMTAEQTRKAWGEPDRINRSSTGETWVYELPAANVYVRFTDGKISSWQSYSN